MEGYEECDNGTNNSDTQPDKCRTDCVLPSCGDGVADSNEECDDGIHNSDEIPGACRRNCKAAHCGDGVVDPSLNEECDFGADDSKCSPACLICTSPNDSGAITYYNYSRLCPGEWQLGIQVSVPYSLLDCNGAKLIGNGKGSTGILVSGTGAIVRNCDVSGFTTGIHITAENVGLYANKVCGNSKDIINDSESHGQDNECRNVINWQEDGHTGCTTPCPVKTYAPLNINGPAGNIDRSKLNIKAQQTRTTTPAIRQPSKQRKTVRQNTRQPSSSQTATKIRTTRKPVTHLAAAEYNFYEMAAKVKWSSKAGKIVLGRNRTPQRGVVQKLAQTTLTNGRKATKVLLTQPNQQSGGFVQGTYPFQRLNKNAKFSAVVALLPAAPRNAKAHFELILREGRTNRVIASRMIQGGKPARLTADLSRWANKKVHLILRVSSVKEGKTLLPAIWINPQLK